MGRRVQRPAPHARRTPATLAGILAREDLPASWLARASEPAVKAALVANTAATNHAGAFEAPTFVVDGRHLFWGQDRLDLVGRARAGWTPWSSR